MSRLHPFLTLFSVGLLLVSCNVNKFAPSKSAFIGGGNVLGEGPILTSITPTSWGVTGGGTVSISGSNLSDTAAVYLGGVAATGITIVGGTLVVATMPAHHAEVVDVVVQNTGGQSGTLIGAFSYNSFLYSANQSNTVSAFVISSSNGSLASAGVVAAPGGSYGSEIDPTNRYYYTAGVTANAIGVYSINPGNGSLTVIPGSPFAAGGGVNGLVFSKTGAFLFASNFNGNTVNCFQVDSNTGALTIRGTVAAAAGAGGITLDPNDRFLYVTNNGANNISGYSVAVDCSLTPIVGSPWTSGNGPDGITIHPNGNFLYSGNAGGNSVSIFSRDTSSGALTSLGSVSIPNAAGGSGVIIDSTGSHLYATAFGAGKVVAFSINSATGALTTLGTVSAQVGTNDVRIQAEGKLVFTANSSSNSVSAFIRDVAVGTLGAAPTPNVTVGNNPGIIAITDAVR